MKCFLRIEVSFTLPSIVGSSPVSLSFSSSSRSVSSSDILPTTLSFRLLSITDRPGNTSLLNHLFHYSLPSINSIIRRRGSGVLMLHQIIAEVHNTLAGSVLEQWVQLILNIHCLFYCE